MNKVIATQPLTEHHTALTIAAADVAAEAAAGHLVMARIADQVLFTPHALADFDAETGQVTLVIRNRATAMPQATPGSASTTVNAETPPAGAEPSLPSIELRGPIGQPGLISGSGKVLCVGEDLGAAALFPRLRQYKKNGAYTIVVVSYPSKDQVYWIDRIEPLCDELFVVTEDGSYGIKGPIRQTVKAICQHVTDIERAVVIGSLTTMKKCTSVTRDYGIATTISLAAVIEDEDQLLAMREPGDTPANGNGDSATSDHADVASDQLAAAVSDHPVTATGEEAGCGHFDWHNAADLDGHTVDFDRLSDLIGLQPAK